MKKSFFSVVCTVVALLCIFTLFPQSSFAADTGNLQGTAYFSKDTCLAYAKSFIAETVSDDSRTTWTKDTQFSEITCTYDVDGNVNAYIINLQTDGKETGYILIEAFSAGVPNVMEFGYDGVYYLTDEKHFKDLDSQKIIYTGDRGFYTVSDGQYYIAENHKKTSLSKADIKSDYTEKRNLANNYRAKSDGQVIAAESQINGIGTSMVQASSSNVVTVPNLTQLVASTEDDFDNLDGDCAEVCGINLLKYWRTCRGVSNLFINNSIPTSFTSLLSYMHYSGSTTDSNAYNGMQAYLTGNHLTAALGRDYKTQSGFSWSWIKTQINNGNVFYMNAVAADYCPGLPGNHAFLGVGYKEESGKDYVNVIDEFGTSLNNFYNYTWSNVSTIWYYRWA